MSRNACIRIGTAFVAVVIGVSAGSVRGADIFVDAAAPCPGLGTAANPYCSIQNAISAGTTQPGDTIHVAAGAYNENVNVNKNDLTLLATDGPDTTAVIANSALIPVVSINANNVTLGLPDQGFRIVQQSSAPTSMAVRVDGPVIGNQVTTIQDNTLAGTNANQGIFIEGGVTNGHLVIQNNVFGKTIGATFGFNTLIRFGTTLLGAVPASADASTIDLLNNSGTDFRMTAISFGALVDNSTVTINPSTYTAESPNAGPTVGVSIPSIRNNATVEILDSTFENVQRGVSMGSTVDTGGSLNVARCAFTGLTDFGVGLNAVTNGSSLTVEGNTMTADPAGMADGVSVPGGVMPTSTANIADNTITGFSEVGVRIGTGLTGLTDGSSLSVVGNTMAAHAAGAERGILTAGPQDASSATLDENEISGFTEDGIFVGATDGGSTLTVNGNMLTAFDPTGAVNAIQILAPGLNQSSATIGGNQAGGYTNAGLLIPQLTGSSSLVANSNVMEAHADGSLRGVSIGDVENGSEITMIGSAFSGFTEGGFIVDDDVNDGSTVTVTDSTFVAHVDGSTDGVRVSNGIEDGSTLTCDRNTIEGFTDTGIYARDANEGSTLSCDANLMAAHHTGAVSGIFIDRGVDEGSSASCDENVIEGFTTQGIFCMVVRIGSSLSASNNELISEDGADFGIHIPLQITDAAVGHFDGNIIEGFTNAAIFVGGTDDSLNDGSAASFDGNELIAHESGAPNGIFLNGGIDESPVSMRGNTIEGFNTNGIYVGGGLEGSLSNASTLLISDNLLAAAEAGATHGINFHLNLGGDGALRGGSWLTVTGNEITGFTEDAFRAGAMEGGAGLRLSNNIFTAHESGATGGILLSGIVLDGHVTMRDNRISNIGVGISMAGVHRVRNLMMRRNALTAAAGGQYGIYFGDAVAGASLNDGIDALLGENVISDFTEASIYFDGALLDGITLNITDNAMLGAAQFGVHFEDIMNGVSASVVNNHIDGFQQDGLDFAGTVNFSSVLIAQNHISGGSTDTGVDLEGPIMNTSHVDVQGNCFANVPVGVEVGDAINDASFVTVNDNDLAGVADTGVNNVGGDLVHTVDATNNWWGTANGPGVDGNADNVGFVLADPFLVAVPDSDNDGVPNCTDACPGTPPGNLADENGCSFCQLDDDNDTVLNCEDVCPVDDDRFDSNDDGTPDCAEFKGPGGGIGVPPDTDGDGVSDPLDQCPNTAPNAPVDANGCSTEDDDGDGVTNDLDLCPNTPACAFGNLDDDGCPVDADGDGLVDGCDVCPDSDDLTDTDGDGFPDCLDPCPDDGDSDGDGVDDCLDLCPDDAGKLNPGVCGCGTPDTDTDGDGVADCVDNCPTAQNANQADADGDGIGDLCDATPTPPAPPAPTPPPTPPAPTPTPEEPEPVGPLCAFCGIGCPQMMIMSFLGLAMMGFTQRRRRF